MACAQASLRMLNKMELSRAHFTLSNALVRRSAFKLPSMRHFKVTATAQENAQPAGTNALQESNKASALADRPSLATTLSSLDHWDPFRLSTSSVKQMLDIVDRLLGDTSSPNVNPTFMRTPWDVVEDDNAFKLHIDMPGFGKDEVKVYIEDGDLVVTANKGQGNEQDKWSSRARRSYHTRITLPKNIEADKIGAKVVHGLLEVCIPKKQMERQVVDVKVE